MTKQKLRYGPLRVGIGGPVGAGKTSMTEALCRVLGDEISMAVITNDIYTSEDADYLVRAQALSSDRIRGVETGGCPHTAIREDASVNLAAMEALKQQFPDLELPPLNQAHNLAATAPSWLTSQSADCVCVGADIPRKKGPTKSDMLVVNKVELAEHVEVDLEQMREDTRENRGELPFIFGSMRKGVGVNELVEFLKTEGGLH